MDTITSIFIACASTIPGFILIAIGILCMGFSGAPGALVFEIGKVRKSLFVKSLGIALAGMAQAFVASACCVLFLAFAHYIQFSQSDLPSWPLYIAAFLHSVAIPGYAAQDTGAKSTAQFLALPIVWVAVLTTFFVGIYAPKLLQPMFEWIPWYGYILNGVGA